VLAGSFTRPTTAQRGDAIHADYGPLGSVSFRLV
jgi:2-oxo-hept-3-ene-1,7-dioate hydratase